MRGAEYVGPARTAVGYWVVPHAEGYPALVRGAAGNGFVQGEVYRVEPAHLSELDEFEECPALYRREPIELDDGSEVEAYLKGPV